MPARSKKTVKPKARAARGTTVAKPAAQAKSAIRKVAKKANAARSPARTLTPEARKKLAGEHLRALLEEKKRLAGQTPPWQQIEHHDNGPRAPEHQPHGGTAPGGEPTPDTGHGNDS